VKKLDRTIHYRLSNEHSFYKTLTINLITAIHRFLPGGTYLIRETEEKDKVIFNLPGPLEGLGKLECKILKRY
jgi:hypothetical protein